MDACPGGRKGCKVGGGEGGTASISREETDCADETDGGVDVDDDIAIIAREQETGAGTIIMEALENYTRTITKLQGHAQAWTSALPGTAHSVPGFHKRRSRLTESNTPAAC